MTWLNALDPISKIIRPNSQLHKSFQKDTIDVQFTILNQAFSHSLHYKELLGSLVTHLEVNYETVEKLSIERQLELTW